MLCIILFNNRNVFYGSENFCYICSGVFFVSENYSVCREIRIIIPVILVQTDTCHMLKSQSYLVWQDNMNMVFQMSDWDVLLFQEIACCIFRCFNVSGDMLLHKVFMCSGQWISWPGKMYKYFKPVTIVFIVYKDVSDVISFLIKICYIIVM